MPRYHPNLPQSAALFSEPTDSCAVTGLPSQATDFTRATPKRNAKHPQGKILSANESSLHASFERRTLFPRVFAVLPIHSIARKSQNFKAF